MNSNLSKIIVIAGTNASGKRSLAIDLAKKYGGEIVSADSRQVYREDISLFFVGGTGLYISSVVCGYDFQKETIDAAYRNELGKN